MTPFLKLRYVIDFLFESFGYTTNMTALSAFSFRYANKTLLINNVADAIYGGILNCKQLVPDVTIKEFLSEIEKTYCGKFAVDEVTKIASFYTYKTQLGALPDIDLSAYIASKVKLQATEFTTVQFKEKSDTTVNTTTSEENVTVIEFDFLKMVDINDNYRVNVDSFSKQLSIPMLQIADVIHLNSSIVVAGVTTTETATASALIQLISIDDTWEVMYVNILSPYGYKNISYKCGKALFLMEFIDEYESWMPPFVAIQSFYADYIAFKLNSNIPITAEMNIPAPMLEQLKLHTPKLLNGQPVMIESLKYALGKKGTQQVTLRTLRPYADR
jgi:hypothetical protein